MRHDEAGDSRNGHPETPLTFEAANLRRGTSYLSNLDAGVVMAGITFLAHPSAWRARFTPTERPSRALSALGAIAAAPAAVYAIGQLDIHAAIGPRDEHHKFGHWVVMTVDALLSPLFDAVAAWMLTGWRFAL